MKIYGRDIQEKADFYSLSEYFPFVSLAEYTDSAFTGSDDNSDAFEVALADAARLGVGLHIPGGSIIRLTRQMSPATGTRIFGAGPSSVIRADGNFRPLVMDGVNNVVLQNFKIDFIHGASGQGQVGLRFNEAEDCYASDIIIDRPMLNGIEVVSSTRIYHDRIQILSPRIFGLFYLDSTHCVDKSVYIFESGSFSHEFKSAQDCVSYDVYVVNPLTAYGCTIWTGWSTGGPTQELPGNLLCRRCGYYNPTVIGGAGSEHLIYITSSPECFVIGGYVEQHPDSVWPPLSINATSYYNEGAVMSCISDGTATITGISDPDGQLFVGARIHCGGDNVAGVNRNYTILTLPGDGTATLDGPVGISGTLNIGFTSKCDGNIIRGLRLKGRNVVVGADVIDIAGTYGRDGANAAGFSTDDPITGIVLDSITVDGLQGNRYGLYVTALARVTIIKGDYTGCTDSQIRVGDQAEVVDMGAHIYSSVDIDTDGVEIESAGRYYKSAGIVENFGLVGVNVLSGGFCAVTGGGIRNCGEYAAILYANCIVTGTEIRHIRDGAGGLSGSILVKESNILVAGNVFDAEGSTGLDSYIKEDTGATNNRFGPNVYVAGPATNVALAADSVSSILGRFKEQPGTAAPTTGTWAPGDKIWKIDPFATGYVGFVCVTGGTPGAWKGFGQIQA